MGKILVVDDNEVNRMLVADILDEHGYQCDTFETVIEGVNSYKIRKYDVVLMDIQMPEISGIDGLKIIKDLDPLAVVFALTANAFESQTDEYLTIGFDDVIVKPYSVKELIRKIERVI